MRFELAIIGFTMAVILSELTIHVSAFTGSVNSPGLALLISVGAILPPGALFFWVLTSQNKDLMRIASAIAPSVLLIYAGQFALADARSPLAQPLIFGTACAGPLIGSALLYRARYKANKSGAIGLYALTGALLIPTVYFIGILPVDQLREIVYAAMIFSLTPLLYQLIVFLSFDESHEAGELAEALNSITDQIQSTLDYDEILTCVLNDAAGVIGAESAAITVLEEGIWSGRYQFGFLKGAAARLTPEEARVTAFTQTLTEPAAVSDVFKDSRIDREIIDKYHFRSILAAPLRIQNSFLGVLTFNFHSRAVVFTDAQVDFSKKLSISVARALHNAWIYEREKRGSAFSRSLNEINLAISSTFDVDTLVERAVTESAKAIGCESAGIVMHEDSSWVLRFEYGSSGAPVGQLFSEAELRDFARTGDLREPLVVNDLENDRQIDLQVMKTFGLRSVMLIPLVVRNKTVGILAFGHLSEAIPFDTLTADFVVKVAASLALAIESAELYADQQNIADTLQKAVLGLPEEVPGIELRHVYHAADPVGEVGGDFIDAFEIAHGQICILAGDVSGKGLEAATITALVKHTLKAYLFEGGSPSTIVKKTSDVVYRESKPLTFVTLFFGIFEIETGRLSYCGAGHPPAILKTGEGEQILLQTNSPAIGAFPKAEFHESEIEIRPADILVLYTDGVTEARHGGEMFGQDRLIEAVSESSSLEIVPQDILDKVISFTGQSLSDDIAILAISPKRRATQQEAA